MLLKYVREKVVKKQQPEFTDSSWLGTSFCPPPSGKGPCRCGPLPPYRWGHRGRRRSDFSQSAQGRGWYTPVPPAPHKPSGLLFHSDQGGLYTMGRVLPTFQLEGEGHTSHSKQLQLQRILQLHLPTNVAGSRSIPKHS